MAHSFYTQLLTKITEAINTNIGDTASKVSGELATVGTTLMGIYVALWGWSMIRGMIQEPVTDGLVRILKMVAIFAIATNVGLFNTYLSGWMQNAGDSLATTIVGAGSSAPGAALDEAWNKTDEMASKLYKKAQDNSTMGIPDIGFLMAAYIVWASGLALTAYACFLVALGKVGLGVVLGLGPIFILCLMFETTRNFFSSWLGQALNFIFLIVLTACGINLFIKIFTQYLTGHQGDELGILGACEVSAVCTVGWVVMMQLPQIASALSGGASVGTMGMISRLGGIAMAKATGGASMAFKMATGRSMSQWAMRGASKARRATAGAAKKTAGAAGSAIKSGAGSVYRRITQSSNRISRAA